MEGRVGIAVSSQKYRILHRTPRPERTIGGPCRTGRLVYSYGKHTHGVYSIYWKVNDNLQIVRIAADMCRDVKLAVRQIGYLFDNKLEFRTILASVEPLHDLIKNQYQIKGRVLFVRR